MKSVIAGAIVGLAMLTGLRSLALSGAGAIDKTFNGTGLVVTDVGPFDNGNAVVVESVGRIVAGSSRGVDSGNDDFAAMRFLPNGAVDTSFCGGRTSVAYGVAGDDDTWGSAVAIGQRFLLQGGRRDKSLLSTA